MEIIGNAIDMAPYAKDISAIYVSVGWGEGYTDEQIRKMYASVIYRLAVVDGVAVGLLRAFSDDVVETHVMELAIHKDHQNKGYGSELLRALMDAYAHTAVYVVTFAENKGFFEKFGLQDKSSRLMVYSRAAR